MAQEVRCQERIKTLDRAEDKRGPLDSVKAIVHGSDVTEIVGHIHRVEWMSRTLHHRNRIRTITAFSPGCTCRIDGRVPGSRGLQTPHAQHAAAERPSGGTWPPPSSTTSQEGMGMR
jgi:hypothetical protein